MTTIKIEQKLGWASRNAANEYIKEWLDKGWIVKSFDVIHRDVVYSPLIYFLFERQIEEVGQ